MRPSLTLCDQLIVRICCIYRSLSQKDQRIFSLLLFSADSLGKGDCVFNMRYGFFFGVIILWDMGLQGGTQCIIKGKEEGVGMIFQEVMCGT